MTDPFTSAAKAMGVDPEEVRESMRNVLQYAEKNGTSNEDLLSWTWTAGATYGRDHLAEGDLSDREVLAALNAHQKPFMSHGSPHLPDSLAHFDQDEVDAMRAALEAMLQVRASK